MCLGICAGLENIRGYRHHVGSIGGPTETFSNHYSTIVLTGLREVLNGSRIMPRDVIGTVDVIFVQFSFVFVWIKKVVWFNLFALLMFVPRSIFGQIFIANICMNVRA